MRILLLLAIIAKVEFEAWTDKYKEENVIDDDVHEYVTNNSDSQAAKTKPLIKIHKPVDPRTERYKIRDLHPSTGTPTRNLSKFVQISIKHIPPRLKYQAKDTKEVCQKLQRINDLLAPLPPSTRIAIWDVTNLYSNVDNGMGIPAVDRLLGKYPNPDGVSKQCILDGLDICLRCNACRYQAGDEAWRYFNHNRGTSTGPCHACEYVDCFMGSLDDHIVEHAPVPLISSLLTADLKTQNEDLDFTRYRDDGINLLLDPSHKEPFYQHLNSVNPNIKWTSPDWTEVNNFGLMADYLDLQIKLENGILEVEDNSHSDHNYISRSSCHPPSVFKGLRLGVGIQLRRNCSTEEGFDKMMEERINQFACSGWNKDSTRNEFLKAKRLDRRELLFGEKKKKRKNISAWSTKWDPRTPSKGQIIHEYENILYSDPVCSKVFPKGSIIPCNRRLKNIAEMIKPTLPNRFPEHGPEEEKGYFKCDRCDLCRHTPANTKSFKSPWDGRKWKIEKHITCLSKNVIYLVICTLHENCWYIGSSDTVRRRWSKHKSDWNNGNRTCRLATHGQDVPQPAEPSLQFLTILPIDTTRNKQDLLNRGP